MVVVVVIIVVVRMRFYHVHRMLQMMRGWHHVEGRRHVDGNNGTGWHLIGHHHLYGHARDRTRHHHLPSRHEIGWYLHVDSHVPGRRLVGRCHVWWYSLMMLLMLLLLLWKSSRMLEMLVRMKHSVVLLLKLLLLWWCHRKIGRNSSIMLGHKRRGEWHWRSQIVMVAHIEMW